MGRTCALLLLSALLVAGNDSGFLAAMKTIMFGNEQTNRTSQDSVIQPAPPSGGYSFHQYSSNSRQLTPSGSSCTLPQQIGTGPYRIPRWYFNPARGRCELFYWSGCCGNGNNFQTFQSCQNICEATRQFPLPACSCCLQPFSFGYGGQFLTRFYFDTNSWTCRPFIYGGKGGYGNVFETAYHCSQKCLPDQLPTPLPTPPPVDPCSQEHEAGVGAVQLQRFFFNKETRICEEFQYFGGGGNRNNFQTLQECQTQCPESPNPCAVATTGPLTACNPGVNSCGVGYYCHVGVTTQTTVCCPKPSAVDKCQQPLNIGIGNANVQRWYFNPLTQQCQACTYRGLQGNENNFLSKQECESSCLINPCRVGTPYRSQGVTVQCSATNPSVCPAGYYCHVGGDASTSVCCQALENSPCEESMIQGEGDAALTRFYYEPMQRKCLAFNYLGSKGTRNNFLTKDACETTCPVWVNPCAVGQPILTMEQKPYLCHQGAPCTQGYFCHLGFDDATTVCCPSEGDPCTLLVKEGQGLQAMSRWFYNQQTRQCQPFTYNGMGGNENNFLLREHCESTCPVWVNACPSGEPYLLPNGRPQPCDATVEGSCPVTHWCHPGPDASTTMCCPGKTDPCLQALTEGEGPLALTRFYFDAASRQCLEFSFKGLRGNSNNFVSKEDCETRCPVQVNPCPVSFSSLRHSVKIVACSSSLTCPDKQWCHIGETKETTVCCPNAVADPCTAPPRNPGVGEFHATRWAFDGSTRKCVPFEYKGMRGNSNNFVSREVCEKRCPVFENPCKLGEPYSENNRYQQCNPQSQCPSTYYCHVGSEANYCCPMLGGDPCGQPLDRGQGSSQLTRWYWNMQGQCCQPFSYCGMKGTQNNFLSQQDCERTCYELDNPCALGEPQMGTDSRPLQCSLQANTCDGSHWCHFGANQATTVCCPGKVEGPAICQQPMTVGTGDANLPRYYYDQTTRQCKQFFYKGRTGNQNNFLTLQDCEQTCPIFVNVCPSGTPQLDSVGRPIPCTFGTDSCDSSHWCHLGLVPDEYQCCPGTPAVPGACQGLPFTEGDFGAAALPATRYYYDQDTMSCKQFIYNGRKGNQNNFLTKDDCEATCNVFTNPCNQPIPLPPQTCAAGSNTCGASSYCHIGATPDTTVCCPSEGNPCLLPLARGDGNQFMDRWYYNQQSATCQPFTYAGLHGNQNNFLNRQDCEDQCGPNPCFEGRPFAGIDGRPQTCSSSANLNTCPLNHWCHIGQDMSTTVCCPGAATNICNLPMSTGEGNANLERFYFDQTTRSCRPFVYNGLKGNQNNFITLRACQLACQPLDNPCIGQPATTAAGQVLFCSATNKDACPVNFWCHLGATPETTVCCPGATNPCSVPLAPGTGNAGLGRWYYNPDERQCLPFQYNGMRGNQNNFLQQAECDRTCPVFENPCMGNVAKTDAGAPMTCNPMAKEDCPTGFFCLAGNTNEEKDSYCCPRLNQDTCNAYTSQGDGSKSYTRFYYNPLEGDCFNFTYYGRNGNENNFVTKKQCQERCKPIANVCFAGEPPLMNGARIVQCHDKPCPSGHYCHVGADARSTVCCAKKGSPCDQQLMTGVGEAQLLRFFYDVVNDECRPFEYTGIAGNENNFATKAQCQIACPGYRGFCPHGKPLITGGKMEACGIDTNCPAGNVCHVAKRDSKSVCCPDPAIFCPMPKDSGPCNGNSTRYAYDRENGVCRKFLFGGCQGNLNNFETLEKCTEICCDKGYY